MVPQTYPVISVKSDKFSYLGFISQSSTIHQNFLVVNQIMHVCMCVYTQMRCPQNALEMPRGKNQCVLAHYC